MKILISAYACLPGRGSEPGIGWNTAVHMASRHDVWVVTRGDNRPEIEAELTRRPVPRLHVIYHDVPGWTRGRRALEAHYQLWQLGLYRVARTLHESEHFDLTHHVSYVRWWTPSLLALLPVPFVWGPVGGVEVVGAPFRSGLRTRPRVEESVRDLLNWVSRRHPLVRLTARRSSLALANNEGTASILRALGSPRVRVMGESGLDEVALAPFKAPAPVGAPVQFASLTRLLHWKGVHLGLEAFARLDDEHAQYAIVGEGPELEPLRALARRLGVADRVQFRGDLSRDEWFHILRTCDALVHPCLANSGSAVSLEAMAAARPVVCLDISGIRQQVTPETGFCVPASTPEEAIAGLTDAMRTVANEPNRVRAMGQRARERVEQHFTWEVRAERLDAAYAEALGSPARLEAGALEASAAVAAE